MKRAGVLLLGAAPLIAAGVYFVVPGDSADPAGAPAAAASSSAATGSARADAKDRAEDKREEAEREADDALIADLPPGLAAPAKKELAEQLVSSAENSTTDWRTAYGTIEDLGDGDGYTAGIIGFCTGTHDLLTLVERYTEGHPDNGLAAYLPALREVDGSDSHEGLDPGFTAAWRAEAEVPAFRAAQEEERDRVYFEPAVRLAKLDGLGTLGQFVYYDAMVFHGPDTDAEGFYGLRERAMREAGTPGQGGSEKAYLSAFLDIRKQAMEAKRPGIDTSRVDTAQRRFLTAGNMKLATPLVWEMYGDTYRVP